jgi:hypothetical protein
MTLTKEAWGLMDKEARKQEIKAQAEHKVWRESEISNLILRCAKDVFAIVDKEIIISKETGIKKIIVKLDINQILEDCDFTELKKTLRVSPTNIFNCALDNVKAELESKDFIVCQLFKAGCAQTYRYLIIDWK